MLEYKFIKFMKFRNICNRARCVYIQTTDNNLTSIAILLFCYRVTVSIEDTSSMN